MERGWGGEVSPLVVWGVLDCEEYGSLLLANVLSFDLTDSIINKITIMNFHRTPYVHELSELCLSWRMCLYLVKESNGTSEAVPEVWSAVSVVSSSGNSTSTVIFSSCRDERCPVQTSQVGKIKLMCFPDGHLYKIWQYFVITELAPPLKTFCMELSACV